MIDDHAHPFPLEAQPLDLAELTLDVEPGEAAAAARRRMAPTRLAVEQLTVALGSLLGCRPEDAIAARDEQAAADWGAWVGRLFAAGDIDGVIFDGGRRAVGDDGLDALGGLAGVPAWELARVEAVIDPLIGEGASAAEVLAAVDDSLEHAGDRRVVGMKTVIAYRTGLAVDPGVDLAAAEASLHPTAGSVGGVVGAGGSVGEVVGAAAAVRRRGKALRDLVFLRLLEHSAERRLPLQVHTGFGDSEIRLADADPLLLEEVLRTPAGRAAQVVLIHGSWPWHEQAGYLASVRANVWSELSLANLFTPATCADRLLRLVDVAPASKVLVGTDGHGPPESHWFAAHTARAAWSEVRRRLDGTVRSAWLDDVARRIFAANAVELYQLA